MATKGSRITARKWNGDDTHSWAIFVDGKVLVSGLTRAEVPYHKAQAQRMMDKKES